jgi:hypothetical protein
MSSPVKPSIYTFQQKKQLSTKIDELKNKKIYKNIFKIIYDNKNEYITNERGIFINMNTLSDETLTKIIEFLDTIPNNKNLTQSKISEKIMEKKVDATDVVQTVSWTSEQNKDDSLAKSFNLCLND